MRIIILIFAIAALLNNGCSIEGLQGPQGIPGKNGANGVNGTNGTNGTTATYVVELCPTETDLPQYGVCIDNKLYGIYRSGSTSFLSELPTGNYSTNSPNGNCTFTVITNCVLQ